MTAAKRAKLLGCKNLSEVSTETEQSLQTLGNWFKNKPKLFEVVCIGVKAKQVKDKSE